MRRQCDRDATGPCAAGCQPALLSLGLVIDRPPRCLGDGCTIDFADAQVDPSQRPFRCELEIHRRREGPQPQAEMTELDKPDFQSPFFATVFEEKSSSISMPHASSTMEWGADRSAILKFKNNKPFLSQFDKTFLLASPLEKSFTDFFSHVLFVPVMYRIAASGKKSQQPLYYSLTSSTIILPSDSLSNEEPVKLMGDQEFIPSQRQFNGKLLLEVPRYVVSPGFYKVVSKKDTIGQIAFDLDKNESLLPSLTGEEAKSALGGQSNISIFRANSSETFSTEIKERYLGTPLWKQAVLLALLFLLAEVLLIRFLK